MTMLNGDQSASVQTIERFAEDSARFMTDEADSLRKLIEREERVREELRIHTNACADRLRRLNRALAALTGQPAAAPTKKDAKEWSVSPAKIEEVFAAFSASDEPISSHRLAVSVDGLSNASVFKAIPILREQGRLRLVGKARGGGRLYAAVAQEEVSLDG